MVLGSIVHDFVLDQVVWPLEPVRWQQRLCGQRGRNFPSERSRRRWGWKRLPALWSPNRQPGAHKQARIQELGHDRQTFFVAQASFSPKTCPGLAMNHCHEGGAARLPPGPLDTADQRFREHAVISAP